MRVSPETTLRRHPGDVGKVPKGFPFIPVIDTIPNQTGRNPAILLRRAWREGKRIRKRTIANLSRLPPETAAARPADAT